jgi:hypothetical protein
MQDANGQMSVSYADMHGRTVATALPGASPITLQALNLTNTSVYKNPGWKGSSAEIAGKGIKYLEGQ